MQIFLQERFSRYFTRTSSLSLSLLWRLKFIFEAIATSYIEEFLLLAERSEANKCTLPDGVLVVEVICPDFCPKLKIYFNLKSLLLKLFALIFVPHCKFKSLLLKLFARIFVPQCKLESLLLKLFALIFVP